MDHQDCIDICHRCAADCYHCLSEMAGMESPNECPKCCIDCSTLCQTAAALMAAGSPYFKEICRLCAEACERCAAACAEHDHDHCQRCAASSRRCAEACRSMAA